MRLTRDLVVNPEKRQHMGAAARKEVGSFTLTISMRSKERPGPVDVTCSHRGAGHPTPLHARPSDLRGKLSMEGDGITIK